MTHIIQVDDIVYIAGDGFRRPWIVRTVNPRYEGVESFADVESTHQKLTVPLYTLHLFPARELSKEYYALQVKILRKTND